jgi:hypothetical protein
VDTLLLDRSRWDLVLDSDGNIAVASNPYALAQDAACSIRLFLGELWYDTTQGVPYFENIMGLPPPVEFMKSRFVAAALTVPEIASAVAYITDIQNRVVSGEVYVTTADGATLSATF